MANNPYISLLKIAWQYARQEKKRFLLVYALFIVANIIFSLNPIWYGWFIDKIQLKGVDVLKDTWIYGIGFLLLRFVAKSPTAYAKRYAICSGNHRTIRHPAKYAYAAILSFTYIARFTINIL